MINTDFRVSKSLLGYYIYGYITRPNSFPNWSSGTLVSQHGQLIVSCPSLPPTPPHGTPGVIVGVSIVATEWVRARRFDTCHGPSWSDWVMHPPRMLIFGGFFIFEGYGRTYRLTHFESWNFCHLLCSTYYYYSSIMLECHLRGV
jgi:hypothetical protein